mgnify:CR=1 FL=1
MKRNFFSSVKLCFSAAAKIIIAVLICVLSSFATVFPLYIFAAKAPGIYGMTIALLCAAALIYFLIKKLRTVSVKKILKFIIIAALCAAGLIVSVKFLLYGTRLFAFFSVVIAVILCVFVAKSIHTDEKKD